MLFVLMNENLCGYDISKKLYQLTEGRLEIKQRVMYPTLNSLSNLGYVQQVYMQKIGRKKKVYDITDKGHMAVIDEMNRLENIVSEIKSVVEGGMKSE